MPTALLLPGTLFLVLDEPCLRGGRRTFLDFVALVVSPYSDAIRAVVRRPVCEPQSAHIPVAPWEKALGAGRNESTPPREETGRSPCHRSILSDSAT